MNGITKLSPYRLTKKAHKVAEFCAFENFDVLESHETQVIAQYYVVQNGWEAMLDNKNIHKIAPLAHIQVSKNTGNVKFLALQPQLFNTGMKTLAIQQVLEKLVVNCAFEGVKAQA